MLREELVIEQLGFRSANKEDLWVEFDGHVVPLIEESTGHKRSLGEIVSGIFVHKENPKLLLLVPDLKDKVVIGMLEEKGLTKYISMKINNPNIDMEFVETTLQTYVDKYWMERG